MVPRCDSRRIWRALAGATGRVGGNAALPMARHTGGRNVGLRYKVSSGRAGDSGTRANTESLPSRPT
jgi:hypothetical protein